MTRRRYAHWCDICHGHTGPGSPCAEDAPEDEDEDEDSGIDPDEAMRRREDEAAYQRWEDRRGDDY